MQPLQHVQITQLADYHYRTWRIVVDPATTSLEDVFRPEFWVNASSKMAPGDFVRIMFKDGSVDFMATILSKPETGAGLNVGRFPRAAGAILAGTEAVIAAAEAAAFMKVAPSKDREGRDLPRVETVGNDWRVIDLAGNVASTHKTEAHAKVALGKYVASLKLAPAA